MSEEIGKYAAGRFVCRLPGCHDPEQHRHSTASLMDLVVMLTNQEDRMRAENASLRAREKAKDERIERLESQILCAFNYPIKGTVGMVAYEMTREWDRLTKELVGWKHPFQSTPSPSQPVKVAGGKCAHQWDTLHPAEDLSKTVGRRCEICGVCEWDPPAVAPVESLTEDPASAFERLTGDCPPSPGKGG